MDDINNQSPQQDLSQTNIEGTYQIQLQEPKKLTLSLKIVAVLFIISGISAVIEVFIKLLHNHIDINFGILAIPTGFGILKLSKGWRVCGLVLIWIGFIALAILFFVGFSGPLDLLIWGRPTTKIPGYYAPIVAIPVFIILLWEYYVLTCRQTKGLFGIK